MEASAGNSDPDFVRKDDSAVSVAGFLSSSEASGRRALRHMGKEFCVTWCGAGVGGDFNLFRSEGQ